MSSFRTAFLSCVVALTHAGMVMGQAFNGTNGTAGTTSLPAADRLSVSVTQGNSIRAVLTSPDAGPVVLDRLPGGPWTSTSSAQGTFLPSSIVAAGLSNAEVQVFGVDQGTLADYHASRTADAWQRARIDQRVVMGKPCAAALGSGAYVFAQGANGGLIASERTDGRWAAVPALEAAFSGGASSIACGTVRMSPASVVVLANSGQGARVATVDTAGRTAISTLQDRMGRAVALSGEAVIASSENSVDIFATTPAGTVAHWIEAKGSTAWNFSPEALPVTSVSSAAWWQGKLYLVASNASGQPGLFSKAPGGQWSNHPLGPPAGESFRGTPVLAAQPDRLSALVLLQSGKLLAMYTETGAAWLNEIPPSTTAAGADKNQVQEKISASAAASPADNAAALDTYIDSIALLIPPPAQAPSVVETKTTYTVQQGVRFANLTFTNLHSTNLSEIVTTDPNSDLLYPGSVIQGSSVSSAMLAGVALPRSPLTITMTGVTGLGPMAITIPEPTLATVTTGIRDLLQGANVQHTAAVIEYKAETGSTEEDALLNIGVSASYLGQTIKAQVDSDSTQKTNSVAVKFLQRYYMLDMQQPSTPSSLFAANVTAQAAGRFMGTGNPPVYISSVTYGRMLIYTFESTASANDLKIAVNAAFSMGQAGGKVDLTDQQKQILSNSQVHMFAYGGSAMSALRLISGSDFMSQLPSYLTDGANFSFDSPALPLTYTLRFIKDGTIAQVNAATEWFTSASYAVPEVKTFSVSLGRNSNGMTRTGIFVRTGDRVSLNARGSIWSGVFLTGTNQANGWYTWKTPGGSGFPNMKVSPFSLLYEIGNQSPPPYAGFGFASQVNNGDSGELILLINTNNPAGGSGSFTVDVDVERRN